MHIGQAQKDGSSANIQEIPVSMENVRPEGTEYQSITSVDGEDLMRNVHVRRSKKYFYIIHDGDYYSIVDKDNILSLLDEIG